MAIDLFANNASATVSSGGTTAPAAGTSESWTLASIVGLAASTGVTQMRLVDPAASSEIMLLTNLSGTAATVTRGAEGTTPVAHTAGFTVQAVATAANLGVSQHRLPWWSRSGLAVASPYFNQPSGTAWPIINRLYLAPHFIPADTTVSALTINVTAAGATGTVVRMAIYADNGGIPGKLIDQATVAGDVAAYATWTFTSPRSDLGGNLLWVAAGPQGSGNPGSTWLCVPLMGPTVSTGPNPVVGYIDISTAVADNPAVTWEQGNRFPWTAWSVT